jgi:hypothetical protein
MNAWPLLPCGNAVNHEWTLIVCGVAASTAPRLAHAVAASLKQYAEALTKRMGDFSARHKTSLALLRFLFASLRQPSRSSTLRRAAHLPPRWCHIAAATSETVLAHWSPEASCREISKTRVQRPRSTIFRLRQGPKRMCHYCASEYIHPQFQSLHRCCPQPRP